MTDIGTIFLNQINSLANVMVVRNIDTGNRLIDNSLQAIITTIIGVIITFVIKLIINDEWKPCLRKYGYYHKPLSFNSQKVEIPKNFRYSLGFSDDKDILSFASWFLKHNSDKLKSGTIEVGYGLDYYMYQEARTGAVKMSRSDIKNLWDDTDSENEDIDMMTAFQVINVIKEPTPIWLSKDGNYVFIKKMGEKLNFSKDEFETELVLVSNSKEGLTEVVSNIVGNRINKNIKKKNELSIFNAEVSDKGGYVKIEKKGRINKNKTFEKLFFKEKETLVKLLEKFNNKSLYPKNVPIENKLGILLHGPPGTGKSGVIQAIANLVQRNILTINLASIITRKDFDKILSNDPKKYIFVFEEIDCVLDVIGRRDKKKHTDDKPEKDDTIIQLLSLTCGQGEKTELLNKLKKKKTEAQLDLGYILQKIDGLECAEDRLIVATTNYPELIDPALIRPGRLGFKLCLSYCDKIMLKSIISMVFDLDIYQINKLSELITPDMCNYWTPAEVIQNCLLVNNYKDIINVLNKGKKE